MRRHLVAALLLVGAGSAAIAKPMDDAMQQQLLVIYDGYNKALLAGKVGDAIKLRSAQTRASAKKEMPTAAAQQRFLAMAKTMVPDTVKPVHATINASADKASIITVASKTFPKNVKIPGAPPPGSLMHSELTLTFVKESDGWKLDDQIFGPDPTSITKCKDDKYEPETAFDNNKTVSMGGPIVRVDFQPDHTLIVIRVVDEENCAFLSENKEGMLKHGLSPDKLVPYAIVEIEGNPHKTDKQKVLVDSLDVRPEE